jgi:hypothetical protein
MLSIDIKNKNIVAAYSKADILVTHGSIGAEAAKELLKRVEKKKDKTGSNALDVEKDDGKRAVLGASTICEELNSELIEINEGKKTYDDSVIIGGKRSLKSKFTITSGIVHSREASERGYLKRLPSKFIQKFSFDKIKNVVGHMPRVNEGKGIRAEKNDNVLLIDGGLGDSGSNRIYIKGLGTTRELIVNNYKNDKSKNTKWETVKSSDLPNV